MTTELEQEFFNTFGIEPKIEKYCYWECKKPELKDVACESPCNFNKTNIFYPEITDRILLELICIYNSFENDEASLFIPFDINNVKDIALQVITKSIKDKSLNNYYCNDVEKLKAKIQQLFKEGE